MTIDPGTFDIRVFAQELVPGVDAHGGLTLLPAASIGVLIAGWSVIEACGAALMIRSQ